MAILVDRDSAIAWHTVYQLAEKIAASLVAEFPNDPKLGRIDLHLAVDVNGWSTVVRLKGTVIHASRRQKEREPA